MNFECGPRIDSTPVRCLSGDVVKPEVNVVDQVKFADAGVSRFTKRQRVGAATGRLSPSRHSSTRQGAGRRHLFSGRVGHPRRPTRLIGVRRRPHATNDRRHGIGFPRGRRPSSPPFQTSERVCRLSRWPALSLLSGTLLGAPQLRRNSVVNCERTSGLPKRRHQG